MSGIVYLPFYLFTGQHPLPFTSHPPPFFFQLSLLARFSATFGQSSWQLAPFLLLVDLVTSRLGSLSTSPSPFPSLLPPLRQRLHLSTRLPCAFITPSLHGYVTLGAAKLSSGATRVRTCKQTPTWPTGCSGFIPAEGVPLRHPFIFLWGGSFVCTRGSFFFCVCMCM